MSVRLLGAGDIRGIAGRLGVRPTKKFGQNFVVEPGTVRQIAALAGVRPGDVILEVGPGLGSLTLALLASAGPASAAEACGRALHHRASAAGGDAAASRSDEASGAGEGVAGSRSGGVGGVGGDVAVSRVGGVGQAGGDVAGGWGDGVSGSAEDGGRGDAAAAGGRAEDAATEQRGDADATDGGTGDAGEVGRGSGDADGLGGAEVSPVGAGLVPSRLVAVEIDPVLAGELPRTVAERAPDVADRVTVLTADALAVGEQELGAPGPTVLAANLPYNVAVPVVLHLLAVLPSLRRGVVMVQAEVADRMCAAPGSRVYGVPSAKLAWYAAAKPAGTVPRSVFWPVPNVDSKLVTFTRRDPPSTTAAREEVFAVIDAAFGQRRKTLRAALATWAGSPAAAEQYLRAAGVDPGARGESLDVAAYARIAAARQQPVNSA